MKTHRNLSIGRKIYIFMIITIISLVILDLINHKSFEPKDWIFLLYVVIAFLIFKFLKKKSEI
jgi:Ca2+/Na+ antiporter